MSGSVSSIKSEWSKLKGGGRVCISLIGKWPLKHWENKWIFIIIIFLNIIEYSSKGNYSLMISGCSWDLPSLWINNRDTNSKIGFPKKEVSPTCGNGFLSHVKKWTENDCVKNEAEFHVLRNTNGKVLIQSYAVQFNKFHKCISLCQKHSSTI